MQPLFVTGFVAAGLFAFVFVFGATLGAPASAQLNLENNTGQVGTGVETFGFVNETQTAAEGATVDIGPGSNETVQYYTFVPNTVEIEAGESVTWFSSAEMIELHTVTFADPDLMTSIILPFSTSQNDFELVPPFNAGEPIILDHPDATSIVAINKLAFFPSVIDADNATTYLNGTEIEYGMSEDLKMLNSGIIMPPLPEQEVGADPFEANGTDGAMSEMMNDTDVAGEEAMLEEGPFPIVEKFTATFDEPGTYDYFCALHPWMVGQVVVGDGASTASLGDPFTNSTDSVGGDTLGDLR